MKSKIDIILADPYSSRCTHPAPKGAPSAAKIISTRRPALSDFRTTRAASALLGTGPHKYYCIFKHNGIPMTIGSGLE